MKRLIQVEEIGLAVLSLFLFVQLGFEAWWFAVWLLAPDLSMLAYLFGPRAGAIGYDLVHHKAVAVAVYLAGALIAVPALQAAGLVMLGHSSLDRVLCYGLKYADAFGHTHLGMIGKQRT